MAAANNASSSLLLLLEACACCLLLYRLVGERNRILHVALSFPLFCCQLIYLDEN